MDLQGAEVARPWVEKAGAEFTTLVDEDNKLGSYFNFKIIPITILFDENGRLVRGPKSSNIANKKLVSELDDWITEGENSIVMKNAKESLKDFMSEQGSGFATSEAEELFQSGVELLKKNDRVNALLKLKAALVIDGTNYLIRKQIWAIENPEKFYDGRIDTRWQREQMKKNR